MDQETRTLITALTQRIAELETQLAAAPAAASAARAPGADVSRRGLLRRAGTVAAVGLGTAAGGLLGALPASAADGQPLLLGEHNLANSLTLLESNSFHVSNNFGGDSQFALYASRFLVTGTSGLPLADASVCGESDSRHGVAGFSADNLGVLGKTVNGTHGVRGQIGPANSAWPPLARAGVGGDAVGSDAGVAGTATNGYGVIGVSRQGIGVRGASDTVGVEGVGGVGRGVQGYTAAGDAAVYGGVALSGSTSIAVKAQNSGKGNALYATVDNAQNVRPAAVIRHSGAGPALTATSVKGIGATLSGRLAPLRLVPTTTAGKPTTGDHSMGELVVDSAGALYLCTAAGTPGTWKKVTVS